MVGGDEARVGGLNTVSAENGPQHPGPAGWRRRLQEKLGLGLFMVGGGAFEPEPRHQSQAMSHTKKPGARSRENAEKGHEEKRPEGLEAGMTDFLTCGSWESNIWERPSPAAWLSGPS